MANFDLNSPYGLVWKNPDTRKSIPIPLKSVSITASVVHAVAQVEITQFYENKENDPIEASYIFPIDSNGAVTHFQAELDGRVIKGQVKSSEDARSDYDAAVKDKKTVFLGEETKPDVFHLKIGFLKPGSSAKVVIGYVTEVKNDPDSHAIRFFIPTTVAPRYVPPTDDDPKSINLAKMTFSSNSPAPLDIKVIVSIQGDIKSVESLSSHKILVESRGPIPERPSWNKAIITLSGNVTEMDRDFVLLVTPVEAVMKPRIYYETLENGSTAAMTHLVPSFALKEEKVELIIVVDRSQSMEGKSIQMASAALQLFLHSLPTDCYFNVVGFGSKYELLFKEGSSKYGQESLHDAVNYAKCISADFGGTEILEPLNHIYSKPPISGYLRQIFVITDGQVSNTGQVISLVQQNAHNSRLFALGIGPSSSHHLVQGMATAGGGTCAFVEGDESIQTATLSQLKNALQPSLTDIKVEWLGLDNPISVELNQEKTLDGYNKPLGLEMVKGKSFSQSPKNIPPIFDGHQMVVFGIFPSEVDKPSGVRITANSPDGPLTLNITMSDANMLGNTKMLHRLAVVKLIRELEMKEASMRGMSDSVKGEIISLGVEHGITSRHTSYIAVDENLTELYFGSMQRRQIPSQLSTDFRSYPVCASPEFGSSCTDNDERVLKLQARSSGLRSILSKSRAFPQHDSFDQHRSTTSSRATGSISGQSRFQFTLKNHSLHKAASSSAVPSGMEKMIAVVDNQNFDGSFSLTMELCRAISLPYEEVKAEASKEGYDTALLATALAISYLTTYLKEQKDSWNLVVKKAEKWMTQICTDANILQLIIASADGLHKKYGMIKN